MVLILLGLDIERVEWYLSYRDSADTAILSAIRREYPSLSPYLEFIKQRDFQKYNVERLIALGTPKNLVSAIVDLLIEDLYGDKAYRAVVDTFGKYRAYGREKSTYYYILALKKLGRSSYRKKALEFIREKPSSTYAYKLWKELKLDLPPRTKLRLLYFNKRYRQIIEEFPISRETAFYLMSSYYKLRKRNDAYRICKKYRDVLDWNYFLRCAISSEVSGDTALAVEYIKRLHRFKPDKAARLLAWIVLANPKYYNDFMDLKDTHEETLFLKSMLAIRYGDTADALNYLRAIINSSHSAFEKSRAYFWTMKLTEENHLADSVRRVHPFGYYAARLGFPPPVRDTQCIDTTNIKDVVPVLLLEAFGLRKYAFRYVKPSNRLRAAYLLDRFGYYPLSIHLAYSSLGKRPCRDAFDLAFPTPFLPYFREASDSTSVPVSLLYAIAREESRFDTMAVSIAGARGMLQMMPFQFKSRGRGWDFPTGPSRLEPICWQGPITSLMN